MSHKYTVFDVQSNCVLCHVYVREIFRQLLRRREGSPRFRTSVRGCAKRVYGILRFGIFVLGPRSIKKFLKSKEKTKNEGETKRMFKKEPHQNIIFLPRRIVNEKLKKVANTHTRIHRALNFRASLMNFPGILRVSLDRTSSLPMLIFAVNVINNVSNDNWQYGNSQANEHENQTKITRRLVVSSSVLGSCMQERKREKEITGYLFDTIWKKSNVPPSFLRTKTCICF